MDVQARGWLGCLSHTTRLHLSAEVSQHFADTCKVGYHRFATSNGKHTGRMISTSLQLMTQTSPSPDGKQFPLRLVHFSLQCTHALTCSNLPLNEPDP